MGGSLPRIPDGVHDGDGSGNVEHSPDRDADFRDHDGQWNHNAVEYECQDGSDGPSYEEEAVQKMKFLPYRDALHHRDA
jgi:hypothetical protein